MARLLQDAPANRAPRVTRSMSREPSEGPESQDAARTTQLRRQKPEQSALPTVDEDEDSLFVPADDHVLSNPNPNPNPHFGNLDLDLDLGDSGQRALSLAASRTTARTGWSQEQLHHLDPDLIVDRLERVSSLSDDVIDFLLLPDPNARATKLRQVLTPHSRENKLFVRRVKSWVDEKNNYGEQEYVSPDIILRAIFDSENVSSLSEGSWRPDDIIYKINLAQMLRRLLVTCSDPGCDMDEGSNAEDLTQTRDDVLFQLHTHFASAVAGPTFNIGAFKLALHLTTQWCIARLERDLETGQQESPLSLIEDAFLEDGYYRHVEAHHLQDMDTKAQASFVKLCEDVVQKLKAPFAGKDLVSQQAVRQLKEAFPWAVFMRTMIHYHENRRKLLDERIDAAGGVAAIAELLTEELQKRSEQREAARRFPSADSPETPARTFHGNQLSKLKSRSARLSLATPDLPPVASATAQKRQLEPSNIVAATSGKEGKKRQRTESPARPTEQVLAVRQQEPAGSRTTPSASHVTKKPSIFDPNPNAVRVEFGTGFSQDDDDSDDENDFEPTQDQGFQTDARAFSAADARRSHVPPPYQPTFQVAPTAPVATSSRRDASNESGGEGYTHSRAAVGSALPLATQPLDPDAPRLSAGTLLQQARSTMRAQTISLKARNPPRERREWTDLEEETFIELLNQHGTSWSTLKEIDMQGDNVLARRNKEDLRWKARNLKLMWLKSMTGLPSGPEWKHWDNVLLSKGERDQLHRRGIPYFQEAVRRQH